MTTPQDRYIQVGQICARYWSGGNHGSPVVLIHGLGEYVETWTPSFEALASEHRVYAVDLPGHGRTDKPPSASYDIAWLAKFADGFRAALGFEHAHVVGHSLGGAVATRLALMHPAAVDRLVLVASGGLGREVSTLLRAITLPMVGEMMKRPSRSGSADVLRRIVYDPAVVPDELVDLDYRLSILPHAQQSFLKTLRANVNLFGQRSSEYRCHLHGLSSITQPVLIIWGRQDPLLPVAHAEAAARTVPDVQLRILDECGHNPMLEHPQAFNEWVLEFLAD